MPAMPSRRSILIDLVLFSIGLGVVVLLNQTPVQDYLSLTNPRERTLRDFAKFDRKLSREPEIARALQGVTGEEARSLKLRELSQRGTTRLDNDTLIERARILSLVYAHMSDRACADIERASGYTENDADELTQALTALGHAGVSRWMEVLRRATLAEVRKYPKPIVTRTEVMAAFVELQKKIGSKAAIRVDAGVNVHSPDAELAYAARTIYSIAPRLPEPHGVVLLRMMEGAYKED